MASNRPSSRFSHQDSQTPGAFSAENIDKLNNLFSDKSGAESSERRFLYAFIRRRLIAFNLEGKYSEIDILHEAYLRAHKYVVTTEQKITHPTAWIKGTSFNIIRELSRKEQRQINLDRQMKLNAETHAEQAETETDDEIKTLKTALEHLNDVERTLVQLSIIEGKSYQEIRKIMCASGKGDFSEGSLRIRKARALKKLRELFEANSPT